MEGKAINTTITIGEINLEELIGKSLLNHLYEGIYFVDISREIKFWNKGAENITGYKSSEMLGQKCRNNFLKFEDDESKSVSCLLDSSLKKKKELKERVYLQHKDNHKIPVWVQISFLTNDSKEIIGAVVVFNDDSDYEKLKNANAKLEILNEKLEKLTETDPLTRLQNRRYFNDQAQKEINRAKRYNRMVAILMLDIDHFKKINDTYGHLVGDVVLKKVSRTLKESTRESDIVCRYGGEEFIILLPETNADQAFQVAEKIRSNVENLKLKIQNIKLDIRISIGIATKAPENNLKLNDLVNMADKGLYKAKESGRNQTIIYN